MGCEANTPPARSDYVAQGPWSIRGGSLPPARSLDEVVLCRLSQLLGGGRGSRFLQGGRGLVPATAGVFFGF